LALLAIDPAHSGPEVRAKLEGQVRLQPNDPVLRIRLAAMEALQGAAADAAANYEAALTLVPNTPATMAALVQLYSGPLDNPGRIKELETEAHEIDPHDPETCLILARLLYQAGGYAWATTLFEEARHAYPNQPDVALDLAQAYAGSGRLKEAEAAAKEVLRKGAQAPAETADGARRLLSMIAAAKSPAAAQAALPEAKRILGLEPHFVLARFVSAFAEEAAGDFEGAQQAYERITWADPGFLPATCRLAILLAEYGGDDMRAEALAHEAREALPDDPDLAYALGVLNYRRADYAAAIPFLRKCLGQQAANAKAMYYLGMSLCEIKDSVNGKKEIQRSLKLNLPEPEAGRARQFLENPRSARD
jgi:tetratricopeptide (TPR) repeat protein